MPSYTTKRSATAGCRGKLTGLVSQWGRWLHQLVRSVAAHFQDVYHAKILLTFQVEHRREEFLDSLHRSHSRGFVIGNMRSSLNARIAGQTVRLTSLAVDNHTTVPFSELTIAGCGRVRQLERFRIILARDVVKGVIRPGILSQ